MTAFDPPALVTYGAIFVVTTAPVWMRWICSGVAWLANVAMDWWRSR